MGKLVRGACGKVSANFDLYSVLLTFPWALLLSFLFFFQGRVSQLEPEPKYEIDVKLIGSDSNVYNLIGTVRRALVAHGVASVEVAEFTAEATAGDYHALLRTCA